MTKPAANVVAQDGTLDATKDHRRVLDRHLHPAAGYSMWQSHEFGEPHVTAEFAERGGSTIATPGGVEAGKPVTIHYTENAEEGVTAVKLHYQIDGVEQPPLSLKQTDRATGGESRSAPTIHIPHDAKGELAYWFEQTTRKGKTLRDDRSGRVYRQPIVPARGARVYFDRDWNSSVSGELRAGSAVRINYDAARIRSQIGDQWHEHENTLAVSAHVSFDGGQTFNEFPLTAWGNGHTMQTLELALKIPEGAQSMAVYFSGAGVERTMVDSAYGQNYTFPVQPAAQ